jgi:hypothetical protein
MRLWIAEINQHAVAHVFSDEAVEAADRVGDTAMVSADDLAQILGIEAHRKRGRADEIAEHDGELPSLGLAGRGRRRCRRCSDRTAAERGDRR